jgi:hypothetical protein
MKTHIYSLITLAFLFFLFSDGANAQDVEKTVVADCFVRTGAGVQTQDYHLLKHSGGTDRRPFLRFDISGVDTALIKSVHVAMYLSAPFTNPNSMDLKFYKVADNTWDETAQTWPGPVYDPVPCADFTIDSIVGWKKSADLTSYFKERYKESDKLLSLALFSEQTYNSTLTFSSKETAGGNAPVLQIYYKHIVYDTVTVYDTVWVNDTTFHDVYDTTHVVINDTTFHDVYDTIHVVINDTVWFNDTVQVFDTLTHIINDTVVHTVNDTIWHGTYNDTVQVYINDTIWHTVNDTNKVTINDTIWVTVNDTSIISIIDTIKVTVEDTLHIDVYTTGLNPPDNTTELLVYPNPTKSMLHIQCKEFSSLTGYNIKLVDALGSVRWSSTVNSDLFSIDLAAFSKGVYFLEIFNGQDMKIETRKILLQ